MVILVFVTFTHGVPLKEEFEKFFIQNELSNETALEIFSTFEEPEVTQSDQKPELATNFPTLKHLSIDTDIGLKNTIILLKTASAIQELQINGSDQFQCAMNLETSASISLTNLKVLNLEHANSNCLWRFLSLLDLPNLSSLNVYNGKMDSENFECFKRLLKRNGENLEELLIKNTPICDECTLKNLELKSLRSFLIY